MSRFFSSKKSTAPDADTKTTAAAADDAANPSTTGSSGDPVLADPTELRLPQSFSLFYTKGLRWRFYLGREKGQPIYAVDMPMNEWGDVILCDGPDESAPHIAVSRHVSAVKGLVKFWLPPMGMGRGDGHDGPICEELRLRGQMISEKYTFAILVGGGGGSGHGDAQGPLPEKFEWRPAGRLSKIPGMGSMATTYELVRLATGETVAKFSSGTSGGLRSKLASVEFLGSGATGELGGPWALMATMSFVRIWQRFFQSYSVLNNVTAAGA